MNHPIAATQCRARGVRRVAVIGAGSAGIVTAIELLRRGHKPTLFDKGGEFGGVWAKQPTNPVVYQGLRTNLPHCVMQLPELDFPGGLSSYVNAAQLGQYIDLLASTNELRQWTKFRTAVTSAAPTKTGWEIKYISGDFESQNSSTEMKEYFDAVVVASGHYHTPYLPTIPGQENWLNADKSRRILHSAEYRDAEAFRDRVVMVVGGRASGSDIARALRDIVRGLVCLDKGCNEAYSEGHCTRIPVGSSLLPDGGISLPDGNRIQLACDLPIDTIILATGFVYDFEFLDDKALGMQFKGERFVSPLYQHVMHATIPTLGFVGIPLSVPCPLPFFTAQARFLAACWTEPQDTVTTHPVLPSEQERIAWVEQRWKMVGDRTQDMHMMSVGNGAWAYMSELDAFSGKGKGPGNLPTDIQKRRQRFQIVERIYRDRVNRQSSTPWGDDSFRNCNYLVDWDTGSWSVTCP